MKNTSRIILAAVLVLFVLVSMTVPGLAAGTGTITINNTNEAVSMNGHTYTAYKIFDVVYDADTGDYDYTIASPFKSYFEGLNLPDSYGADLDAKAYTYVSKISGDEALQAFARDLYDNKGSATGTSVLADNATSAVITGLDNGYYIVYDEGAQSPANNAEKAIANVALTTASPDATINLKASVPTIDKKITGVSDDATNATAAQGENGVSAKIGQHVGFQIDSIVPDLTGYTEYTYRVTDTMTAGLTPDNNVKVTIGDDDVTAALGDNINITGQVTTIEIPFDILDDYDMDTPITITYSATINANAIVYPSSDGNSNEATLEYSNNIEPASPPETTPESKVNVYLFSLEITKVNADNEPLAGATFTLKVKDGNEIPVELVNGRYKVSDSASATATVVSNENGKIYVDGLAEGTYTLTETAAPDGYNLLKKPVEIEIVATYNDDGECTSVSGNTATVVNKAGGLLPSTGGIGTYIFIAGGAVLMVVAVVLVSRKKKTVSE
ncbi:MAG: SpaH/EbpB family LPXTG-anchored major pilin [Clostridia bacterium]|nr:SpaH/EbpB family LPXTG-anchored major pilin [Clostridia bacterium]